MQVNAIYTVTLEVIVDIPEDVAVEGEETIAEYLEEMDAFTAPNTIPTLVKFEHYESVE